MTSILKNPGCCIDNYQVVLLLNPQMLDLTTTGACAQLAIVRERNNSRHSVCEGNEVQCAAKLCFLTIHPIVPKAVLLDIKHHVKSD